MVLSSLPLQEAEIIPAQGTGTGKETQVAGGLFNTIDVRVLGENFVGFGFDADSGATWDIVKDHRYIYAVCDRREVLIKPR